MKRAPLFGLLIAGCFPTVPDGVVVCDSVADCPDTTWSCVAERCVRSASPDDAGGADGGGMDAATADGGVDGGVDGGASDAGARDAAPSDAGSGDAGPLRCGDGLVFSVSFDGDSLAELCGATPMPFGSPSFVPGRVNSALRLVAGERVDYPSAGLASNTAMTVAMWVRVATNGDRCALGFTDTGPEPSSFFFCPYLGETAMPADGPMMFLPTMPGMCLAANGTSSPAGLVNLGAWHHVAVTIDGATSRAYVDGSLEATGSAAGAPCGSGLGVTLGAEDHDEMFVTFPFDGDLDEVRVYSRALDAREICGLALGTWDGTDCTST